MTLMYKAIAFLIACFAHVATAAAPPVAFDQYTGLGHVQILDALPGGDRTARLHFSSFHYGVIDDAADWAAIARANGNRAALPSNADIDWQTQAVVYVVLADQTNALRFADFTVDDDGAATLSFEWIGIEPFYYDQMPVLFKVVDKDSIEQVSLRVASHEAFGGAVLGTIALR